MTALTLDISALGFREDFTPLPELEEQLELLATYDLWFVEERLKAKGILPEDNIESAILGFRQYLAIRLLGHQGYSPPKEVDEVWHAFILFTKDYAKFCKRVFGQFLHHVPFTSRDAERTPPSIPFHELLSRYFDTSIEDGDPKCAIFCGGNKPEGYAAEHGVVIATKAACGCLNNCNSSGGDSCGACG